MEQSVCTRKNAETCLKKAKRTGVIMATVIAIHLFAVLILLIFISRKKKHKSIFDLQKKEMAIVMNTFLDKDSDSNTSNEDIFEPLVKYEEQDF